MEFFNNVWLWIKENLNGILTVVTSAQYVSIVLTIVKLVKQSKSLADNTGISKELSKSLEKNEKLSDKVQVLGEASIKLHDEQEVTNKKLDEIEQRVNSALDSALNKLNSVVEVMSIVYAGLKDENARKAVNTILTNAKYAETETRLKLLEEINKLKAEAAKMTENMNNLVAESAKKVEEAVVINVEPKQETPVVRY